MENIYVLTSFEHFSSTICEQYIILKETDEKSKFGLLRYPTLRYSDKQGDY